MVPHVYIVGTHHGRFEYPATTKKMGLMNRPRPSASLFIALPNNLRSGCLPHRVWVAGFSAGAEETKRIRHTQVDS